MTYKVMQIETSNFCSLTCLYCPHPTQVRPKGSMTMETFQKCMQLVENSSNPVRNNHKFVWLNHFGEPLLHPLLPDFISYATSHRIEVSFASNGVDPKGNLFPRALWQTLADAGLKVVSLSAHKKSRRILTQHVADIVEVHSVWEPKPWDFHDWAGQVDMSRFKVEERPMPRYPCDYEKDDMFAVTWDGRIAACCYDIEGQVGLTVDDVLRDGFKFREVSLCSKCRLGRGDAQWLMDPLKQIYPEAAGGEPTSTGGHPDDGWQAPPWLRAMLQATRRLAAKRVS